MVLQDKPKFSLIQLLVSAETCIENVAKSDDYARDSVLNAPENLLIRESVDSLCRDGADTPIVRVHWKAFLTREYSRFKPFSAREWPIQPPLHPTIPHK